MSDILKGGTFVNRYLITARLTAESAFHIGDGERDPRTDSNGTSIKVSTVVTDGSGKPYLPGSSIRGSIREWLKKHFQQMDENLVTKDVVEKLKNIKNESDEKVRDEKMRQCISTTSSTFEKLFGSQHNEGKVEVWDAYFCGKQPTTPSNTFLSGWRQDRITYVAKSVAIDPATGTAEENKLYNFELVPEGTEFQLNLSAQNLTDVEAGLLLKLLDAFNDEFDRIALGSMSKRGFGLFNLDQVEVYNVKAGEQLKEWKGLAKQGADAGSFGIRKPEFKMPDSGNSLKIAATEIFQPKTASLLQEKWTVTLETPLVVRSGGKFGWVNAPHSKTRNKDMQFRWGMPKGTLEEISDLNFSIKIEDKEAKPYYHVPSSSIRGSLRDWTITNLLPRDYWNVEEYIKTLLTPLHSVPNLDDILDLFGSAIDGKTEAVSKFYTKAGRLTIVAKAFTHGETEPVMAGTWAKIGNNYGPHNAKRHIKPRNPLDRITHSAKLKGLHNFLEFSVGQSFTITFAIKDPTPFDEELLKAWKREIKDGMIRFGGLTGIGRGRISIAENPVQEGTSNVAQSQPI